MSLERNKRKVIQGIVTSTKMEKTIVVTVKTYKVDPLYKKRVRYTKKYKAHDENGIASLGDVVSIMETRPLSATKHFRLVKIVEKNTDKMLAKGSE